jgi:prepilin-type N-terminal cleavage/methylation domain-containing protein
MLHSLTAVAEVNEMQTKNLNVNKKKAQQAGFSLVELLVAMLISLTLIFACTALYSSLKSSIDTAQRLAKAQESLRGAFYLMSRSIRQADSFEITSGGALTMTYGPGLTGIEIYNCMGKSVSGSTDTYYRSVDKELRCVDGPENEAIALGVSYLQFTAISDASGTIIEDGLKVTMKIDGMPSSYGDGLTFPLALRQKILLDLAEE